MKKYYLYIDESGQFKHTESHISMVGGYITQKSPNEIKGQIKKRITRFRDNHKEIDLGENDIHAAELLHPENFPDKANREKYKRIPENIRKEFIDGFKTIVENIACFKIKSINEQFTFGDANEQDRYGACLGALFQKAVELINDDTEIEFNFLIAKRSGTCSQMEFDHACYHAELGKYFQDLCSEAKNLTVKSDFPCDRKLLLDLADIACYFLRKDDFDKIETTRPNKVSFNKYRDNYNDFYNELIGNGEYATAYKIAVNKEDKQKVLDKLTELAPDQNDQIRYFLNIAYNLVKIRTNNKNALADAEAIFTELSKISNQKHEFTNLALNGLLLCANHSGQTGKAVGILQKIKRNMSGQSELSLFNNYTNILELRNRAYNDWFNEYNFLEIINGFSDDVEKYETFLSLTKDEGIFDQNDKCYLLHKMLSSLGQAYAFAGRVAGQDYYEIAEQYFNKALEHLPGASDDRRTINYLATLYWYKSDNCKAYKLLRKFDRDLPDKIEEALFYTLKHSDRDAFDFSMILRLLDSQQVNVDLLNKAVKEINKKRFADEHPFELIYKHLGILFMYCEDYKKAAKLFKQAIDICQQKSFTLNTISLPILLLLAIAYKKDQKIDSYKQQLIDFNESYDDLVNKSIYFRSFIDILGGKDTLISHCEAENIDIINQFLPFMYS
ncbi:MAG: hypothetical protein JEZ07_04645 [Phycisphaerae bacterium]|nr:hypothetical protein [Phycisphaerae bacterium]